MTRLQPLLCARRPLGLAFLAVAVLAAGPTARAGLIATDIFRINADLAGDARWPSVAMDTAGNFACTWSRDGDAYARRFSRGGIPLMGDDVRVNADTAGTQMYPRVASDADGNFVVAWEHVIDTPYSRSIYARQFDAGGTPMTGDDFRVNADTADYHFVPSVAADADGNFVVAWERIGTGGTSDTRGIHARRFASDGTPRDSDDFKVDRGTFREVGAKPRVAMEPDGDFVVVWNDYDSGGSDYTVYARRYQASGTPVTGSVDVAGGDTDEYGVVRADVAVNANGDFAVAWNTRKFSHQIVRLQRCASDGSLLGGPFSAGWDYCTGRSAIACDQAGNFVVVTGLADTVEARRFTATGDPIGDVLIISDSTGTPWGLDVSMSPTGDFVVVWDNSEDVYGRVYHEAQATLATTPGDGGTLDFGNTLVGATASRLLEVQNAGEPTSSLSGTFPAAGGEFGHDTSEAFGPLGQGESDGRDYTYAPLGRGADSVGVTVTSDGGNSTITLSGTGVAPVNSVALVSNAGLVRIGTTGSAQVSVTNVGDGNLSGLGDVSNLRGDVALAPGSPPEFTGGTPVSLADGASQTFTYTYAPTSHGLQQAIVRGDFLNGSADGTNQPEIVDQTITGTGVGPVFDSSVPPGGVIDFGAVVLGGNALRQLLVSNISTDPNGGDPSLTDLTLLAAEITGPDAALFSLIGFSAGTVLSQAEADIFDIAFSASGPTGAKTAVLALTTDQGAALGESGATFTFGLTGTVLQTNGAIPEPAALGLVALGLAGLARRRRAQKPYDTHMGPIGRTGAGLPRVLSALLPTNH